MVRMGKDEKVFVERELVTVNRMPTRNTFSFELSEQATFFSRHIC